MPKQWTPRGYQGRSLKLVASEPAAGLLLDPGMGKTTVMLALLVLLKKKAPRTRFLVIAPLRVAYSAWPDEIAKWKDFGHLNAVVLHGPKKDKLLSADADVFIINPEGLAWLSTKLDTWKKRPTVLVVDESTKFKHANTKRFKILKGMLDYFKRRYILTGTPTPNGLLDLFGQMYILDGGERLGRFITHYRNAFFYQTGFGGYKWLPKADSFDKIVERISPITLRLDAKDYLDLPPRIVTDIPVDLPKKAHDQYRVLEKDFVLKLKKGDVTAFNAGALSMKLRQLTGGFMYLDQTQGRYEQVHGAKMDALIDLYESLQGAPLLVSYEFQPERDVLCAYFDAPYIGGGVSAKRGRMLVNQWNHGEIPILFCHPQSVAHGLNLQDGGHHLCIYTPTWNLEYYEQFIRRLDRQGQKFPVNVYRLVVPGTVDRTVLRGIEKKDGDQRSLLDALKEDLL